MSLGLRPEYLDSRYIRLLRSLSLLAGIAVAGVGALTLTGWLLEVDLLKRVLQTDRVTMNPLASTAFLLCGASLLLQRGGRKGWRHLGQALALVVILLALLKIAAYQSGWSWSPDRILFEYRLAGSRMAPHSAPS